MSPARGPEHGAPRRPECWGVADPLTSPKDALVGDTGSMEGQAPQGPAGTELEADPLRAPGRWRGWCRREGSLRTVADEGQLLSDGTAVRAARGSFLSATRRLGRCNKQSPEISK